MNDTRPKTIFCDIDGTLVEHMKPSEATMPFSCMKPLPGAVDKLLEWERKGYNIILTTGRRNCARKQTEEQLANAGIVYDQLIMGFGGGKRYLINDRKPNGQEDYAVAINIERNTGIGNIEL
tara:strand:- start:286 stop:651 length:366 start_codon:yes stop_codon:yes gene_type:complete